MTPKSNKNSSQESSPEPEFGLSGAPLSPSRYPLTAFIPASIPASQLPCEKALFMYLTCICLHTASGSTPSRPYPVANCMQRSPVTRSITNPLSFSFCPTPFSSPRRYAKSKQSPPSICSTATTRTSQCEQYCYEMQSSHSRIRILLQALFRNLRLLRNMGVSRIRKVRL